jgi:hypothetical protein
MTRTDFFARLKVIDCYAVPGCSDGKRRGISTSPGHPRKDIFCDKDWWTYILEYMKKQGGYSTNTKRSLSH